MKPLSGVAVEDAASRGQEATPGRGQELVGVSAVVPTIFSASSPDLRAVAGVVHHLVTGASPVVAVAALGAASETWAVRPEVRPHLLAAIVDAVAGRVPVLVGVSDDHLEQARRTAAVAASSGASHLMVRLPAHTQKSSAPSATHLQRLHDESGLPLVLQDLPTVGEQGMAPAAISALVSEVPSLVAVKLEGLDSGFSVSALGGLPVPVIVGWGGINLPDRLRRGATGCMPGAGTAKAFVDIISSWEKDTLAGEALYRRLLPLISYAGQSLDLMIAATKRILVRLGVVENALTVPAGAEPDALQLATLDTLIEELVGADLLGPSEC